MEHSDITVIAVAAQDEFVNGADTRDRVANLADRAAVQSLEVASVIRFFVIERTQRKFDIHLAGLYGEWPPEVLPVTAETREGVLRNQFRFAVVIVQRKRAAWLAAETDCDLAAWL